MPWSNQSGGGSGGGGPWGQRGGSGGGGPWGGGSGGGNGNPPDLEEILRRSQDRLKNLVPGGGLGGRGLVLGALALVAIWLLSGVYFVRPNEVGLNLVFGKFIGKTGEGANWNWPYPVGNVVKPQVTNVSTTEVGFRTVESVRQSRQTDVTEESLMLTGDENIVDIDFIVQWQIDPAVPENYVFNIQDPPGTVKAVAESAMREIIGKRNIQPVLTTDRGAIETEVRQLMQDTLNGYKAGVQIRLVQLQKVDPPQQVIDAFRDVQAARADQERLRNEAQTYANRVVPEARGRAAQLVQSAEAYKEQTVAEARGQASRFTAVYEQYKNAPGVTRERLFLETMERVMGGTDKIILDSTGNGQGVVPYLPLEQLQRLPARGGQQQGATR
ncbi:MAG: FtsH protease activity modulator HflK [Bosea sp.]|uniref:FtsH protease activity modulator HflK n=1 Tax=unclassified Bosea (in: a-proteobacteria) TaxID=2653178 RepID=UPI00095F78C1|nr:MULTISPECIES: FtsH protease activity modulator HflK [unclassified Bosea (in: a-proteobacteria)]MBN9443063.1 FtsH protease activity modulator HflK [Bosea sp. (in: a-proteobacteria)]MBN9456194.1 FtsH protease activity modulator HflK [Bosea sp. (in: a-proteobacteria)]OJV05692.1 MAG: HflK protein [Bosea sp. 67-29]